MLSPFCLIKNFIYMKCERVRTFEHWNFDGTHDMLSFAPPPILVEYKRLKKEENISISQSWGAVWMKVMFPCPVSLKCHCSLIKKSYRAVPAVHRTNLIWKCLNVAKFGFAFVYMGFFFGVYSLHYMHTSGWVRHCFFLKFLLLFLEWSCVRFSWEFSWYNFSEW